MVDQKPMKGRLQFWKEQAAIYDEKKIDSLVLLMGSEIIADYRDKCEKRIFERVVPLDRSASVLDVGCGTGRWEVFLARRCHRIVAFDFSQDLLDIAAQRAAMSGAQNVTFLCTSLEEFETEEKFDLAIISSVLACVADDDAKKILERLGSIILPNGWIFNLEFTAIREAYRGEKNSEYIMRTQKQLVSLFNASGFDLMAEGYAFPPLVLPSIFYRAVVPDRFKETYLCEVLLRAALSVQYKVIDPILNRMEWIWRPLVYFKRAYPVHHRWYLYTRRSNL